MNEFLMKELSTKFDLHPAAPEGTMHSFAAMELVEEKGMRAFVDAYQPLMKALDEKAVAAYFGGYMSSAALALQYSVSGYSLAPEFSLANLNIHLVPADGYCRVAFSLKEWNMEQAPEGEKSRAFWRNEVLTRFYQETAGSLFRSISQVSGLILGEIWGQLPTKFNYYVDTFATGISDPVLLKRIEDDYRYLKDEMPAEVFLMPRNPFHVKVRSIESLADPDKTVQMRNRCCMYYRTEGGSYCYTCPRIKEDERAARREVYRAEMA